jgi:hypothetical protein
VSTQVPAVTVAWRVAAAAVVAARVRRPEAVAAVAAALRTCGVGHLHRVTASSSLEVVVAAAAVVVA